MTRTAALASLMAIGAACADAPAETPTIRIDLDAEWRNGAEESSELSFDTQGFATPTSARAWYRSKVFQTRAPRNAVALTIRQSHDWRNWSPIENLGPANLRDAPVLLAVADDDYWMFGRYQPPPDSDAHAASDAHLDGFNTPLRTTPFGRQFDAPGGLRPSRGGYHAWQSRDMVHWVHHGPVTERFSRWVTTAELVDGKVVLYYDYPNDQDPHAYLDDDLTDGEPGENVGLVFADPSDGSDCGAIRDRQGVIHLFYEDWSTINAREHAWDSPVAGHALSEAARGPFRIGPPAIDLRTRPTGVKGRYLHPHWKQHPDWDSNVAEYDVHEPAQQAYGDWAPISIGDQHYLFGDCHRPGEKMCVAWFTSPDLNGGFELCGRIGVGHPDPDIVFAEGVFYLATQMETDYVSPGPWVEQVSARCGVDSSGDARIDHWTDWRVVSESYQRVPGFAKQVDRIPARLDLRDLPQGSGFAVELQIECDKNSSAVPVLDAIIVSLK